MSRLRRLKKLRRKNRIKATACGLALALVIGSAQGLGTYALFTDVEDASSNLAISTGDVDVEVGNGFDINEVQPGDNLTNTFTITNHGTLNQHIRLELTNIPSQDIVTQSSINFGIQTEEVASTRNFNEVGENISPIINMINTGENTLKNDQTHENFILKPGQKITANINVKISETLDQQTLQQKEYEMKLKVIASQISKDNELMDNGFKDIEIQTNRFTIGEYIPNIISGDNIKVSANGPNSTSVNVTLKFVGVIEDDLSNLENIEIVNGTNSGAFVNSRVKGFNKNTFVISGVDKTLIDGKDFGRENTIQLKFIYKDKSEKIFSFDFRDIDVVQGNLKLQAKYEEINTLSEQDPIDEEVENFVESEVVEQPKEDIEEQIEQEVVEQLREEITEIPKQPEAIEQPKENEGIQE